MAKATRKTATAPRAEQPPLEGVVIPDGAKLPQDHKEKDAKETHKVVTVRGKEWSVPLDALDDFELLDDLNALDQRDDPTRLPAVLRRLLGGDQWKLAMEVLREKESGRVRTEAGASFVMELIQALNPNSSRS